ncbi:ATP-binding cassette domain-containing protein [Limosilactobacillus mucosae]
MLSIKNVIKRFGEVLGFVGQNGAGKSTTFKMIMNFLKPDQGTIVGQPLDEKSLDQIGFLPEERGLYLDMTIKEQVLYFASLHGFDLKITAADLPLWMNRLSAKENEKSRIKNLSKGNQQKVQLITAIVRVW